MAELHWAEDFNYDRFTGFRRRGGSALNLASSAWRAEEYLAHAHELLEPELSAMAEHEAYYKRHSPSPSDRGRYRNCVDECSRAVQCVTDRFIDTLRLVHTGPQKDHKRKARSRGPDPRLNDQQLEDAARRAIADDWARLGDRFEAALTWPNEFPRRLAALADTDVLRALSGMLWVNQVRRAVVHKYEDPSLSQALAFLSIATMYCHLLIAKLQWVWEELELESDHGEHLSLHFRPASGLIRFKYSIDVENLSRAADYLATNAEVTKLKAQLRGLGGQPTSMRCDRKRDAEVRDFANTIQSNVPEPAKWEGEVSLIDPIRYGHWLAVILAWSGRASK